MATPLYVQVTSPNELGGFGVWPATPGPGTVQLMFLASDNYTGVGSRPLGLNGWNEFAWQVSSGGTNNHKIQAFYRYTEPTDTRTVVYCFTPQIGARDDVFAMEITSVDPVWANVFKSVKNTVVTSDVRFLVQSGDPTPSDNVLALCFYNGAQLFESKPTLVNSDMWISISSGNFFKYGFGIARRNEATAGAAPYCVASWSEAGTRGTGFMIYLGESGGGPGPGPSGGAIGRSFPLSFGNREFPLDTSRTFPRA